jgi:hypothetical protein
MDDRIKYSMSLKRCVSLANKFVGEQGFGILAYDIIGSSQMDLRFFLDTRDVLREDLNARFKEYFHPGFGVYGLRDRFEISSGDKASACIGSSEGVEKIILYHWENYVNFPVRWVVAKHFRDFAFKRL